MRLFIAVQLDETTRKHLVAIQDQLREKTVQANFSRPENLHLTLAFLGEIEAKQVPRIQQAMDQTPLEPLNLVFDHTGCFARDGGNIWWIGLQKNPALLRMQQELTVQLFQEGIQLEDRRFRPHLTLARQVVLQEAGEDGTLLDKPFCMETQAIHLMRSERIRGVLTYSEQYTRRVAKP